jgi:flagellar protein FlaG
MIDMKATGSDRIALVQQNTTPLSSSAANTYGREQAATIGKVESGNGLPQNVEKMAEVTNEQVRNAVSKLNDYVQSMERTLDFQMDEESGKTVIKVFDKTSSELIRQIPNELALELAQNLNDEEPSLLFSAQV